MTDIAPTSGFPGVISGPLARLGRRAQRGTDGHRQAPDADFDPPRRRERPPHHQALRPGARQETLRESNLLLITDEIFSAPQPLSRADLSIRTGMTRSTVSRLVDDLLSAGIVREGSPIVGGTRGRPAVPLLPARRTLAGLGVEINVEFMAARVLDLTGAVLAEEIIDGDFRSSDPTDVLPRVGEMARRVSREASDLGATVVGTVLALPGLVSTAGDHLLLAPNLGWRDLDAISLMTGAGSTQAQSDTGIQQSAAAAQNTAIPQNAQVREDFGGFVAVANEAKLAALSIAQELTAVDREEQTFLYVSARLGVGAAAVVDGVVDAGPRGWAGEIGHITVQPDGPRCGCGAHGCLEVYAGKRALLANAGLQPPVSARTLSEMADQDGEAGAQIRAALDKAGWALGVALSGALNVLDIQDVVLGGEFGPLADHLRPRIEVELGERVLAARWSSFRVREPGEWEHNAAPATTGGALRALRAVVDAPQYWVPQEESAG